jgi:hypothetical protein
MAILHSFVPVLADLLHFDIYLSPPVIAAVSLTLFIILVKWILQTIKP